MVHLVTGFAGENHITSADDGALNQAIIGRGCFVLEGNDANGWGYFGSEIIDNNTVRIHCGEGVMDGRHFRIEPGTFEDVKIDNGQAGMQRYDIIVVTYDKDTTTGIESAYLEVIKGTPKASYPSLPTYENGDIYQGATKCRFRLYDVFIDGVELKSVTRRFKIQCSLEAWDRFVGDSEYMKVEGIIDSNTVTQAIGDLGNYVHDLNSNFSQFGNCVFLADGILNAWDEITISGDRNLSEYRYIYIELQDAGTTCFDAKMIPIQVYATKNVSCPYHFYKGSDILGYACAPDDINTNRIRLRSSSTTTRIRAYGII